MTPCPQIFVSIGSVLPFERLIKAMDQWALENPQASVFCQIGDGDYQPTYANWTRHLPVPSYKEALRSCSVFVAHVGMGSILQASEYGCPMVLMPRLPQRHEVTTDHQLHTAQRLQGRPGLTFATNEEELKRRLSWLLRDGPVTQAKLGPHASEEFISKLREFIRGADLMH